MNAKSKMADNLLSMTVTEGVTVNVLLNEQYEFLMTTKEVAHGYGTSDYVVRKTMLRHSDELSEGKHYITGEFLLNTFSKGGTKCPTLANIQPHQIFWTKRGIVRLGFFIKSKRAVMFRDWAEDLIIVIDQQTDLFGSVVHNPVFEIPKKRNHNRLTQERMISILSDVAKIDDRVLRLSLINKLGV